MAIEIDFDGFFLTRSWATNDLKMELDKVRGELLAMKGQFDEKENALLDVDRELETMEAKTEFIVTVIQQTSSLFTPPPPDEKETAYLNAEDLAYSKLHLLEALTGGVGGAAYLLGKLGPTSIKLTSKLGQLTLGAKAANTGKLGAASSTLKLTKTAKMAKAGKLTKAMKFAKFGKGMMGVSAAIMVLEIGMKLSSAGEINDHLKSEKKAIKKQIKTANEELKNYDAAIAERRTLQKNLFEDAGVSDVTGYVRYLNEAIADLGKNKANFAMARRMLMRRMEKEMILAVVEGLETDALDDIAKRLEAEQRLAAGDATADIAQDLNLSQQQLGPIKNIISVRNAIVEGKVHSEISETFDTPPGVVDNEADRINDTLDDIWPVLEGDEQLGDAAQSLIVSVSALEYMRRELRAKIKLDAGEAADQIAAAANVSLDIVKDWASALAAAKIDAGAMSEAERSENLMNIAAAHRLPSTLISQESMYAI